MKIAIVGSRNLKVDILKYIPNEVSEIISGGAKGTDLLAEEYADKNSISKRIIKPEYNRPVLKLHKRRRKYGLQRIFTAAGIKGFRTDRINTVKPLR